MGYNNNHAGMHMIWFPRRFEDWTYDRSIEEQWRAKLMNKKEISKTEETPVISSNTGKDSAAVSIEKQNNIPKKKKKRKNQSMKNQVKYGNEFVINNEFFFDTDLVTKNIMYMALKNKKDIFTILKEADELMEKDIRINPDPESEWYGFPLLNKSMIYMRIIADKLDCNYREFFLDNSDLIKKYIYKMIDGISLDSWEGDIDEEGNADIRISFFDRNYLGTIHGITGLEELHEINKHGSMDLVLQKECIEGTAYYSVAYGSLIIKPRKNNIVWGAYLMEEEKGKVKDLVEKLIEMNPDWVY